MLLKQRKSRLVMFVDISGSSDLYRNLGDSQAKKTIDATFQQLSGLLKKSKGKLIKTIGDEWMLTFSTVLDGAEFAIESQQLLEQNLLSLRIGADYGEIIADKGDVFGEVVNNAAHLTAMSAGGQIMVSEPIAESLANHNQFQLRAFDQVLLKGQRHPQLVYRLFWQSAGKQRSETQFFTGSILKEIDFQTGIEIRFADRQWHLNLDDSAFTIGRDPTNYLCINSSRVSRKHCLIEYRNGKFVLEDSSTNGCWITSNEAQTNFVRREEFPLLGSGKLALGMPFSESGAPVIEFFQMD